MGDDRSLPPDLASLGIATAEASGLPREHARLVAATLDLDEPEGGELPLLWHWAFFSPTVGTADLGPDGHPVRTHPAMVGFPRRMWAGGEVRSSRALRADWPAIRRSRLVDRQLKHGSSGALMVVVVEHTVEQSGAIVVRERQDLVFREAAGVRTSCGAPVEPPQGVREVWTPGSALLFRFSALTFNSHRIHYDRTYATEIEGYPDLVVHGPLTAIVLAHVAARHLGHPVSSFSFRAIAPLFVDQPVYISAESVLDGDTPAARITATRVDGVIAMAATAG